MLQNGLSDVAQGLGRAYGRVLLSVQLTNPFASAEICSVQGIALPSILHVALSELPLL